jgi:Flp pilus assembly protein TadD
LLIRAAKFLAGRNEETEAHILEAFRTSPRDTSANRYALIAGIAKCLSGRDEEAVVWLSRSIELRPNVSSAHFYLAAALARLGRLGEARAGLELIRALPSRDSAPRRSATIPPISRAASEGMTASAGGVPEE